MLLEMGELGEADTESTLAAWVWMADGVVAGRDGDANGDGVGEGPSGADLVEKRRYLRLSRVSSNGADRS